MKITIDRTPNGGFLKAWIVVDGERWASMHEYKGGRYRSYTFRKIGSDITIGDAKGRDWIYRGRLDNERGVIERVQQIVDGGCLKHPTEEAAAAKLRREEYQRKQRESEERESNEFRAKASEAFVAIVAAWGDGGNEGSAVADKAITAILDAMRWAQTQ